MLDLEPGRSSGHRRAEVDGLSGRGPRLWGVTLTEGVGERGAADTLVCCATRLARARLCVSACGSGDRAQGSWGVRWDVGAGYAVRALRGDTPPSLFSNTVHIYLDHLAQPLYTFLRSSLSCVSPWTL